MRRCSPVLLLMLLAASAAAEVRIAVVLDASHDMWGQLDDGQRRFIAARIALEAWSLARSGDDGVSASLWRIGGEVPRTEHGGCESVTVEVPQGPIDAAAWRAVLDQTRPLGERPLLRAVAEAATELGEGGDPRRVVLITSGDDTCYGSLDAAAEALANGVEVRVVGLGLPGPAVERYSAIAPTRNADTAEAFLSALEWALEELPVPTPSDTGIRIRAQGFREFDGAALVHEITAEHHELTRSGQSAGQFDGAAPPGRYGLELTDADGQVVERVEGLRVGAGSPLEAVLDLLPPTLPDFEVVPDRPWSGGPVFVNVNGLGPGAFRLWMGRPEDPEGAWFDAVAISGPAGSAELRAPDETGPLEIRLYDQPAAGAFRVVARTSLEVEQPNASIEAPVEIKPLHALAVTWTGPNNDGDHLVLVPADGPSHPAASCRLTSAGSPLLLAAPGEEGPWEIRYVSGLAGEIFARAAVTVTSVIVVLDAPGEVPAGQPFEVSWEGPAGPADYLAIALEGAANGEYISLALASHGSPARFDAPREPGSYEVRYLAGSDNRILRSSELTVVAIPVQITAPRRVRVGTRFEVSWSGPDRPGDLLAVARPGDPPHVSEDWAYTSMGSPTSLAAPFDPGRYEVRYVTQKGHQILDAIPLQVVE